MRLAVLVAAAWAACIPGLGYAAAPLRVCLLEHDGALSEKTSGQGFDVDLSRAVAAQIGRTFQPVWIHNEVKMTEVDDSDLPLKPLAEGRCDAVPSVPGRDALGEFDELLRLTRPYYGAGFELVTPGGAKGDIGGLQGKRVSVQSVTIAHGVAQAIGLRWSAQPTPAQQLAELDGKRVDAALVWGPALGEFGRKPAEGYAPPAILRWNESFATRAKDTDLTEALNSGLAALAENGRIAELLKKHGIPPHRPFDKTFDPVAMRTLQLQGAAHPGLALKTETEVPIATGSDTDKPSAPAAQLKSGPAAPAGPAANAAETSPASAFEKDPAAVKRGRMIYTGTCGAYCHPASGGAATDAPYLFDCDWKHGGRDQDIFHTIKTGVKGTRMVSFDGALSDEDIWKIVAFLRTNSKCAAQKPK